MSSHIMRSSGAKDHQETSIDSLACFLLGDIGSAVKILTRARNLFGTALP